MQPNRFLVVFFYLLCLALGAYAQETGKHKDSQNETAGQLADYMARTAGKKFSGTVLVANDGEKLLHSGYGYSDDAREISNDTLTVYDIGSISKQFTAAAI